MYIVNNKFGRNKDSFKVLFLKKQNDFLEIILLCEDFVHNIQMYTMEERCIILITFYYYT